jgi:hypothetical protein
MEDIQPLNGKILENGTTHHDGRGIPIIASAKPIQIAEGRDGIMLIIDFDDRKLTHRSGTNSRIIGYVIYEISIQITVWKCWSLDPPA